MNNNPFVNQPAPPKTSRFIQILQVFAILTIVLMVTWVVLLEQSQVKGPSMQPNYYTGEFLLVNRIPRYLNSDYERGDVVVFQKPGFDDFVKRVIALPGESIRIAEGRIYINERLIEEEYIADTLYTNGGDLIRENGSSVVVPQGTYALIGDNRPQSNDSRFSGIGFIRKEWIKGKVFLRIWPFEKFTFIGKGEVTIR